MKSMKSIGEDEININLLGEAWKQGQLIRGSFQLLGPGNIQNLGVALCYGNIKKIKTKKNTFEFIRKVNFSLIGNETEKWDFQLAENDPISDKQKSYFLLFGDLEDFNSCGILQIEIRPLKIIDEFIQIFENFHRFKKKEFKSGKAGYVEAKMQAPANKEYTGIKSYICAVKQEAGELYLKHLFDLNVPDFIDGNLSTKLEKKEIIQVLTKKDYLIGDSPNQEKLVKVIDEVLAQIKIKSFV